MRLAYDERKFAELLLYVSERLRGDVAGGATKLNKVLYFAELTHLRRHNSVFSGCEFQKLAHGPAPSQPVPVRRRQLDSGQAEVEQDHCIGLPTHHPVTRRHADPPVNARNAGNEK